MKRLLCTLLLYSSALGLVWLTGWLLISGWYSEKFAKPYEPILNYSALPALITVLICILTETILRKLSVSPAMVLLLMFVLRIAVMLGLSAMAFVVFIAGEQSGKYVIISFVLTAFCFYGAILSAHVASNLVFANELTEKQI